MALMNNEEVLRTCIISRQIKQKRDLFRIVKTKEKKVLLDLSYKIEGRGTYLSRDESIILKAKKQNTISRVFKTPIDEEIYDEMLNIIKGENL